MNDIDIAAVIADAAEAAQAADPGSPYCELMETYIEFGLLLESGRDDVFFVEDCDGMANELVALGREMDQWSEQRWFAWVAKHSTFVGEVEGGQ